MKSTASCYPALRETIENMPVIDCHDHSRQMGPKPTDPVKAVFDWYMRADLISASSDSDVAAIYNEALPLEERWPLLERAWQRSKHTGYAQVVRRVMREFYDEPELSLAGLQRIGEKMIDFSVEENFTAVLDEARSVTRLEDSWPDIKGFIAGTVALPPRSRVVISLPSLHNLHTADEIQANAGILGRHVTSLDEYMDTCRQIFTQMKAAGAVGFKDQSAYNRPIDFGTPTRHQAEEVFNWMLEDPRRMAAYPDGVKPLSDFLFHDFMRAARDLDLPVQIHTGHMAGVRNEITKTNAVQLTRLLEIHHETRFDLFHANWPYSGEILYLVKNYPNVALDFCWAHMIDPLYSQDLLRQVLSSVPHAKIHGFGSDLGGDVVTSAWAHADLARDNIAMALASLVEIDYIALDEAEEIAHGWLFADPNAFFKLGC
jgi:uncharacterized protein